MPPPTRFVRARRWGPRSEAAAPVAAAKEPQRRWLCQGPSQGALLVRPAGALVTPRHLTPGVFLCARCPPCLQKSDADAAHTAANALTSQLLQSLKFRLNMSDGATTLAIDRHREADLYRLSAACVHSTHDLARALRRGGPALGCVVMHAGSGDVDTVVFLLPIATIAAEALVARLEDEKAAQKVTGNARIRVWRGCMYAPQHSVVCVSAACRHRASTCLTIIGWASRSCRLRRSGGRMNRHTLGDQASSRCCYDYWEATNA